MGKKMVVQVHHMVYEDKEKGRREVVCLLRKGFHLAITMLRRFNYFYEDEIEALKYEIGKKRNGLKLSETPEGIERLKTYFKKKGKKKCT